MRTGTYLGDSVYAGFDGHMIELVADGERRIYLEPQVFENLLLYAAKVYGCKITVTTKNRVAEFSSPATEDST